MIDRRGRQDVLGRQVAISTEATDECEVWVQWVCVVVGKEDQLQNRGKDEDLL